MSQTPTTTGPLTVVLVHGAFADASSWTGVIERLQAAGVLVTAPVNPLRGISIDSAYIASVLSQIPGPVLAVGHSYGGAVISTAATNARNVVGLVYVAAFAPDEGERLGEVESTSKDSVLNSALMILRYPTGSGGETAVEYAIDPAKLQAAFAADLPAKQTAVLAAILAGFDWGARTANIVAALWPERCTAMVSVSGYLIGSQQAGKMPLPPAADHRRTGRHLDCKPSSLRVARATH